MSSLFGGSQQSSSSSNQAFGYLKNLLGGNVSAGTNAVNSLSNNLGSFQNYKNNSGFDFALNQGTRQLSGSAAANGLLNSGSTAKGIANYETGLGQQTYNNYLGQLGNLAGLGNQSAGIIGGAGATSQSQGSSQGSAMNGLFGSSGLFG